MEIQFDVEPTDLERRPADKILPKLRCLGILQRQCYSWVQLLQRWRRADANLTTLEKFTVRRQEATPRIALAALYVHLDNA
jgi:hypothetical protein